MSEHSSDASSRPDVSPEAGDAGQVASGAEPGPGDTVGSDVSPEAGDAGQSASGAAPGPVSEESGRARAAAGTVRVSGPPVPPQNVGPDVPKVPAYLRSPQPTDARQRGAQQPPGVLTRLRAASPPAIGPGTLWSVFATALLSALLLGDGLGLNLLIVAVPAALGAYFAARSARRRLRPWTAVWALGGLALLAIPALRDAGWPVFLAMVSALALGSLALHGSRSWPGVLLGSVGLLPSVAGGARWGWRGVRARADDSRGRVRTVARTTAVAVVLLIVFGALFASADAAFADLLGSLTPDVSIGDSPWRVFLFVLGLLGALAAAYSAAAPVRWDGITVRPGTARNRAEWALPLIVLNLLFAVFIGLQLVVLLGGYDKVLEETGLKPAEYARQGFWQLLWATVLTLIVIALALRWAPRGRAGDRTLVRSVLGLLCVLTLVVVASALRRMDLYVDAFGLTRLRISVAAVELWLGVVLVLILAAGVFGARLLPRAVVGSAAVGVLAFGLISPDGLIAEQNVQRHRSGGTIDIEYLKGLSADAVPALNELPEPLRSCALENFQRDFALPDAPWYATSWGEARAREVIEEHPAESQGAKCYDLGRDADERDGYEEEDSYDPY
ncbi:MULTISPECIES: DUF4153 domain-containing protein [unclassified Streptomyces]|uniref:DUF4153 domain-containing protein n=1 Tax=unclassified Streptomyces TaxID=2593676 RepID=UPI002E1267EA|nr:MULTISPECIES: DUF4153 domain-containing protein [unclassified Streptomyces]WSQ77120.1 DUF4173 domain-containing protein [Streptomyces sp. NBC_01213]WSQ84452.1 DUF4173 domain-containing protein [Streptomyces sp. NBC_01212]WSR09494.1 DUF4173 domain-containing protein [Streptomyces sp. NBC_01208]WSR47778.1 DUF4173 domain-containing protein [Streptomyces sp. NBC_01201]